MSRSPHDGPRKLWAGLARLLGTTDLDKVVLHQAEDAGCGYRRATGWIVGALNYQAHRDATVLDRDRLYLHAVAELR